MGVQSLCIMHGLSTHLVQELNVDTVLFTKQLEKWDLPPAVRSQYSSDSSNAREALSLFSECKEHVPLG